MIGYSTFQRLFAAGAVLGLAACTSVDSLETTYVVSEDARAQKLQVSPPPGSAVLTTHANIWAPRQKPEIEEPVYRRAAQTFLLKSGRICKVFDGRATFPVGWEFSYQC
jgi:hypothetical protein